ncbi:spore coat protein [Candidatus Pacearchaeota archaeon CG10_big_fil_rev_8_21_14_0_10_34_76]|nr:MAG: spore coat protein [Candidatus Pacearchaeota archaeon CG10_big_fil_rev_8_21_14_0_10_34_76]
MKGVILAGGTGSRLYPCTKVTNKHLLPVYDKPMIYYPIKTLAEAGIKDILIVSGPGHAGHFLNLLGSGKEFGVDLSYDIQEEAGGIAQALNVGRKFVGNDKCVVILGDNIFEDNIKDSVEKFTRQEQGAKIFLKEVPIESAQRFGCAVIEGDKVVYVEEKPKDPKSNLAMTGLYFFDSEIFRIIDRLSPSARGEFEITDAIDNYVKNGQCTYEVLNGFWSDAGTFESLQKSSNYLSQKSNGSNGGNEIVDEIKRFQEELDSLKKKLTDAFL